MSVIVFLVEALMALFILFRVAKKSSLIHLLYPKQTRQRQPQDSNPKSSERDDRSSECSSSLDSPRVRYIIRQLRRTRLHLNRYREAHANLTESFQSQTKFITNLQVRITRRDEFIAKAEETYAELKSAHDDECTISDIQAEDLAQVREYAQHAYEQHNTLVDKYELLEKQKMVSDEEVEAQRQENEEMKERMKDEGDSLRGLMSEIARLRNEKSELEKAKADQDAVIAKIWQEKVELEEEVKAMKASLDPETPKAATFDSGLMDAAEREERWASSPETKNDSRDKDAGFKLADELGSDNEDGDLMTF